MVSLVSRTRAAAIIHTTGMIKAARPSTGHGTRAGVVGGAGKTSRLRRSSAGRYRRRPGGLFILILTLELAESEAQNHEDGGSAACWQCLWNSRIGAGSEFSSGGGQQNRVITYSGEKGVVVTAHTTAMGMFSALRLSWPVCCLSPSLPSCLGGALGEWERLELNGALLRHWGSRSM